MKRHRGNVDTSLHIARHLQGFAVALALVCGGHGGALAEPPPVQTGGPASPSPSDAQSPPKESFLSALKQGFAEDFEQEVVRGHFDVGSPPDAHRYYCMVKAPRRAKGQMVWQNAASPAC